MYIVLIICLFLFPLNIQSIICPVYNFFNNETNIIHSCDRNVSLCTYITTQSNSRRCLGIYTFNKNLETIENLISIRQLGIVDDFEEKYSNTTECILDVDKTGSHLLCRCNSNNCTLKWKTAENLHENLYQKHKLMKPYEYFNWFFPLMITLTIIIIIFISIIIIVIILKCNMYRKRHEKEYQSYLANTSVASTNISNAEIDEFLSSNPTYQSIISHGKSSIIYRAWTTGKESLPHEKKLVAVKLYHSPQYKNVFENEVQTLRMVHHTAIV
ncbi:unnamed protein product, partial [Rotaria magnacalcarata]